jgi:hypothetical protein
MAKILGSRKWHCGKWQKIVAVKKIPQVANFNGKT